MEKYVLECFVIGFFGIFLLCLKKFKTLINGENNEI